MRVYEIEYGVPFKFKDRVCYKAEFGGRPFLVALSGELNIVELDRDRDIEITMVANVDNIRHPSTTMKNELVEVTVPLGAIRVGDIGFMANGYFVNITQKCMMPMRHVPSHKKIAVATLSITYLKSVDREVEL